MCWAWQRIVLVLLIAACGGPKLNQRTEDVEGFLALFDPESHERLLDEPWDAGPPVGLRPALVDEWMSRRRTSAFHRPINRCINRRSRAS